ncbi:hypothetical protein [Streptosporangium subroseum]|uniref:hypothetical protein n=1 Tax=Streptosporangium subroseum TaxID=106412 RepID=UPI003092E41D|nr:hypothetical protein OHB15_45590 [Streptosporangium subroseum]
MKRTLAVALIALGTALAAGPAHAADPLPIDIGIAADSPAIIDVMATVNGLDIEVPD